MAAGKKTGAALSLADFINVDRERKKNQALATKVFGKGRRNSAPGAAASGGNRKSGPGQSLASRVGVQKQRSVSTVVGKQRGKPAGNVDVEWTHDLHSLNNPAASRVSQLPHNHSRGGRGQARNGQRLLAALNNSTTGNNQFNIVSKPQSSFGMSIRGLAGPYTVVAKNFAPGTTDADIESAMAPIGGEIRSCAIISTHPTTNAEIVFESKEGADNVIQTFNNQTADGRILSVYLSKPAPVSQSTQQPAISAVENVRSVPAARPSPPTGPRASKNSDRGGSRFAGDHYQPRQRSRERRRSYNDDEVMDGSYGFEEKMDIDDGNDGRGQGRGLYSDDLVGSRSRSIGRGTGDSRDGGRGRDRGRRYR